MEIVLQWLDDLDDLMHAAALRWEGLRRACLWMGFVSAAVLAVSRTLAAPPPWLPGLAALAALSVLVWGAGIGALLVVTRRQRRRRPA